MTSSLENPWRQAKNRLQEILDSHCYENWFAPTRFKELANSTVVVSVPSQFFAAWLRDHYLEVVENVLGELDPAHPHVRFEPGQEAVGTDDSPPPAPEAARPVRPHRKASNGKLDGLNEKYTFDRFVVGGSNRFAHAAAKAVAAAPGRAYNPLFMYGGTGLGKTHLMQAIGQEIRERQPGLNIVFVSSERFMNELIRHIAGKSTERFRSKYRKADVLLIDDAHTIAGKEATQEEFFHTFNDLFDQRKQIVLSSDREPKDIAGLEDRLISRFEWGLVTDVQAPDLETREAILENLAGEERIALAPEVTRFIAAHVTRNVRELQGAFVTVLAFSRLTGRAISIEMVQEVLRNMVGQAQLKPITVDIVQRAVAEHFDVRIADLRGQSRQRQVTFPRHVAIYLCKELIPSLSLNAIGEAFGGKDHSTVVHAHKKMSNDIEANAAVRNTVDQLTQIIRS